MRIGNRSVSAISISHGSGRNVYSHRPHFFLSPETDEDAKALLTLNYPVSATRFPKILTHTGIPLSEAPQLLGDRAEGASLLAEALGNTNALGCFRDFVRVLERAFDAPPKELPSLLAQFLSPADLGYTEAEIDQWMLVRNPASHADKKYPDSWVAFERDVTSFIDRMEQAATDVLLNKEVWSDRSLTRRQVWDAGTATLSPQAASG